MFLSNLSIKSAGVRHRHDAGARDAGHGVVPATGHRPLPERRDPGHHDRHHPPGRLAGDRGTGGVEAHRGGGEPDRRRRITWARPPAKACRRSSSSSSSRWTPTRRSRTRARRSRRSVATCPPASRIRSSRSSTSAGCPIVSLAVRSVVALPARSHDARRQEDQAPPGERRRVSARSTWWAPSTREIDRRGQAGPARGAGDGRRRGDGSACARRTSTRRSGG